MDSHPVRRMLDAGVIVTLNTDDPPMFEATLEGEYLAVAQAFALGPEDLRRLAANAVESSFLPPASKAALHAELATV